MRLLCGVCCQCFCCECFVSVLLCNVMLCCVLLFCYAEVHVCFVVAGHVMISYVFFLLCFVLLLFCFVVFYNICYVFRRVLSSRWCVWCCSVSFCCMLLRFVVLLCFHLLCFVSSLFSVLSTVSPQVSAYIKLWMSSVHVQRSLVKLQSVPRNFALSELPTCV